MNLLSYWPTADEVNRCIKFEAEGAHDAVLLAVHQPFPLTYFTVGPDGKVMPDSKVVATEDDLLRYFVSDNVPSGSHVLPISGISGIGKSHIIRILEARLRSLDNADRYLIIRIPKSASLRRVVELILEADPLNDDRYTHVKSEFKKAVSDIPLDKATIRFQGEIQIALKELASSLRQDLINNPNNQSIKERLDHAQRLPLLLSDAETVDYFRSEVLPRIVQRAVGGFDSDKGDSTQGQFKAEDFNLPDRVDLGKAARSVANYYRVALAAQEGRGMVIAAAVLNAVVDQATRQLFKLNQSLGGMTLGELILEIRRLLLADNRDLVILVEDFAALVGIQDTISKVLIQEGTTSRGKEYATIRSAIAITDGFLVGRDTLATRAGREWVVESRLASEAESLQRSKALVASYLNAARLGETELIERYRESFRMARKDGEAYRPLFSSGEDEDDVIVLQSFGYEEQIPLFPFTELAIQCLTKAALTQGDTIVFNPRFIIKNVLREILLSGREAFTVGQFPPPGIEVRNPSTDVAQWLASLTVSEVQRQRYKRVVAIWGNNPQSRAEIGLIPRKVFEVFGLLPPAIEPIKKVSEKIFQKDTKSIDPPPGPEDGRHRQSKDIRQALENWVQEGSFLEQATANPIRNMLSVALNAHIDWNGERCIKVDIRPNQISIPNARGEGGVVSETAIKVASDSKDSDGQLRAELFALLRYYYVFKKQANYDEADEDLARIANLLDRLLPQALEIVRTGVKKQTSAAILLLAANGRMLGLTDRGRTVGIIWPFLFGDVPPLEKLPEYAGSAFQEWRTMQEEAVRVRPQLKALVLAVSGCFQGVGKTANGVDIIRIVDNFPPDAVSSEQTNLDSMTPELKSSLANLSNAKVKVRMRRVVEEAIRIKNQLEKQFGNMFDKNEIAESLKVLAEKLREMGAWDESDIGLSLNGFIGIIEDFRSTALKEALNLLQQVGTLEEGEDGNKKIIQVAQLNLGPLLTGRLFANFATKVVGSAKKRAQLLKTQYRDVDPKVQIKLINVLFMEIMKDINILTTEG